MAARRLASTNGPPSMLPTRLHIDWTRCDGRGLCTELLADQLGRDEWGYPVARNRVGQPSDRSNVPIPANRLADAADAVALCPRQALQLVRAVA